MRFEFTAVLTALFVSSTALAAVSTEETKQLGNTVTAMGAEAAGNKEGIH